MLEDKHKSIRAFFGILLAESLQQQLEILQKQSILQAQNLQWTRLNNLHITLKFIGQLNPTDIQAIHETLTKILEKMDLFYLDLGSLEVFPSIRNPKLLSLSVKSSTPCLKLVKTLNETLQTFDYPLESRLYRGHVTLARFTNQDFDKNLLKNIELPSFPSIAVDRVYLLESKADSLGSQYQPLFSIPLSCQRDSV